MNKQIKLSSNPFLPDINKTHISPLLKVVQINNFMVINGKEYHLNSYKINKELKQVWFDKNVISAIVNSKNKCTQSLYLYLLGHISASSTEIKLDVDALGLKLQYKSSRIYDAIDELISYRVIARINSKSNFYVNPHKLSKVSLVDIYSQYKGNVFDIDSQVKVTL